MYCYVDISIYLHQNRKTPTATFFVGKELHELKVIVSLALFLLRDCSCWYVLCIYCYMTGIVLSILAFMCCFMGLRLSLSLSLLTQCAFRFNRSYQSSSRYLASECKATDFYDRLLLLTRSSCEQQQDTFRAISS